MNKQIPKMMPTPTLLQSTATTQKGHLPQDTTAGRKHSHQILRQLTEVAEVGWPNNHFEGAVLSPVPSLAPKILEIGE